MARDLIGGDEQSNFTAVLLLPGIFTRMNGVALVKPNAYGAHKEIEHLSTSRVRPLGRWLEAFGFKEGAKFTAIGVAGGLLSPSTSPRPLSVRCAWPMSTPACKP